MEVNSVNASIPVERQTPASENKEPKSTEVNETATQENSEAYRVEISQEALNAQATANENPSEPSQVSGSEAVQTYTNAGQIAG